MDLARQHAFVSIQSSLLSAISEGQDLHEKLNSISGFLTSYRIPCPLKCAASTSEIDQHAITLVPEDAPAQKLPLLCTGDGNCLFNAISLHLVGNESLATELRVRAAIAIIQLETEFTASGSEPFRQAIHEQCALYSPFGEYDMHIDTNSVDTEQIKLLFQTETINTLTNGTWSGMWQIIGLATALQMSILSVYPQHNYRIRALFNKTIDPIIGYNTAEEPIAILWSGYLTGNVFHANHFVPLMDLPDQPVGIPSMQKSVVCSLGTGTCKPHDVSQICKAKLFKNKKKVQLKTERKRLSHESSTQISVTNSKTPSQILDAKQILSVEADRLATADANTNNPTPWATPTGTTSAQFLKHLKFEAIFCSTCQQRIIAKNPNRNYIDGPVCYMCAKHLKDSNKPPLHLDFMFPGNIPDTLKSLNHTEIKLVSQVHPYMHMLVLPAGGQYGLRGQSINIPIPLQQICQSLPRSEDTTYVRVFSAKTSYNECVDMRKVKNALLWLHTNNPLYKHITVPMTVMDNNPNGTHHSSEELNGCLNKEFNIPSCRGEHGASLAQNYLSPQNDCENTCVPLDAHEISLVPLDYQIQRKQQDIPCVRLPTIKNKPVNIFNSSNLEELAFPQLYPYGRNGFSDRKGTELTTHQYFSCRILNKDKRWSSNPQYLFWALHIHEQNYLQSAISVALRNRSKANDPINVNDVRNVHTIDVKTDNYMFMRNLRGTAAYWRSELFKLIAKIRTFGPPTFFLSLSANDMHWYDNFKFIDPAMTDSDIDAMTYMQKCTIIKENPVMCALHFKRRWEAFLYHFLLVKPYPLGIVIDYYARVEFQARGTPHVHLFVWVADAPSFDNVADKDFIVPFIDKYISGQLPDVTSSADLKLVKSLQTHSHTFTCLRKYNTKCRFDFPMHVADSTRLKLMTDTGSYSRFYVLQRTSKDVWVNPYNIKVLRNWNANMDIQMVGSSLGAARYVCSYICKNEPFAFRQTVAECIKSLPQDSSQRKILSKIGNILLTHRTISVQETAYRLLGLNMVYSSRDTVFLSTSLPEERFRTLKSRKQLDELPADSTDIYMHGWPQLYEKRPYGQDFQHMSLSEFITHYNITFYVPKTEKANPRICINIGGQTKILKKRTRPAALQCDIPNVQLNREGHFFSLLYLFYPYRNEHELLLPYRTYEESFKHKQNSIDKNLLEQTNLISQFENSLKALLALEEDQLDDIRALTTPSLQQASDQCNFEGIKQPQNIFTYDILLDPNTTDNPQKHLSVDAFSKMAQPTMTDEEFAENQQMMSDSQRTAFETIQNHDPFCNPPLHLFITGGAGTGKSFLLRLIREYLLRKSTSLLPNVLVAAPTGVAAYNINGLTLHSLLQLPTQDKSNAQYHPLSPRSYKILYEAFKQLKYLIIDEVSMVSYNTLEHIHLRLNEVKEKLLDIEYLFGNVSIICFGDLYQLRPVFGSPIFSQTSQNTALHLWKDIFSLHELTENKRQAKDLSYAQLLNRVRTGQHTAEDINVLETRLITQPLSQKPILHIFPLKEQRDSHNSLCISHFSESTELHTIHAIHDVPESFIPETDEKCAGVPKTVTLCVNARVMLIRNIDTKNGLVNGAQGNVHSIEWANCSGKLKPNEMPSCVNVVFDNVTACMKTIQKNAPVGITPLTVKFLGKKHTYVTRTQIPLVLAFATTVHKVQGLTVSEAVVDIGASIFSPGMAYVALSRVPNLLSLHISKLCPPRIKASDAVNAEMKRLREEKALKAQTET